MKASLLSLAAALPLVVTACGGCYGPANHVEHVRVVKRMQPGAANASYGPTRGLEWGQLNVLHTTDTHGWLAGHIKQANYGADWGDFVTFVRRLKTKAANLGVDLLLVDTGDLHDGAGLSDATAVDGELSNPIFQELNDYDLLTIGNHELYVTEVAYQDFYNFSTFWGDRYLTSNVEILNPTTNAWEYIGSRYKYFTTKHGLRVMAFGVLFDFMKNSNVSRVMPAATMVEQDWFLSALNCPEPVDVFLLIGHNPARPDIPGSTFGTIHKAIRRVHADTPIQIFGGHTHVRDFAVLDQSSTALESGRYCETLGWFSMSGFDHSNSGFTGADRPYGVSTPTKKATNTSTSPFVYSRRYLDWNRNTFMYHSIGGQNDSDFDTRRGRCVSKKITVERTKLRLGELYGCVPNTYCMTCAPFGDPLNIFTVLSDAMATIVVNPARNSTPRMVISSTGGIRYDMYKGPFTYDDNFVLSPFKNIFVYLPSIPFAQAEPVLAALNAGGASKKRFAAMAQPRDACVDPTLEPVSGLELRAADTGVGGVTLRQVVETPGYTTEDDFGTDGDDTAHSEIPNYSIPNYFRGNGGFPGIGTPDVVDLVFTDFIEKYVLSALGPSYNSSMVTPYISANFTSQDFLLPYVRQKWQAGMPDCPI